MCDCSGCFDDGDTHLFRPLGMKMGCVGFCFFCAYASVAA